MKKDITFWGTLIILLLFQLYYFKNNSVCDVPIPFLSKITGEAEKNGILFVEYLALLAPVLLLLFYFLDWNDFYISRYGILYATRNVGMGRYLWKICYRMAMYTLVFVVLQMLLYGIFDFKFISENKREVFLRFVDYYFIIQCICELLFFLCVVIGKEVAIVILDMALVVIVLMSGVIKSDLFDFLFFPARIIHEPNPIIGMEWLTAGSMLLWMIWIYFITLIFVKKKDYI